MSGNYMFVMVAQGDTPIYEAEFLNTQRVRPWLGLGLRLGLG